MDLSRRVNDKSRLFHDPRRNRPRFGGGCATDGGGLQGMPEKALQT
jgi:hypothetical protein